MRKTFAIFFVLFGLSFVTEAYLRTRSEPTITSLFPAPTPAELAIYESPIVEVEQPKPPPVSAATTAVSASLPKLAYAAPAEPPPPRTPRKETKRKSVIAQASADSLKSSKSSPLNKMFAARAVGASAEMGGVSQLAMASADATTDTADEKRCRAKMKKLGVVSTDQCTDLSSIVKDLAVGVYSFNKPIKAYVDEPIHITLVLKTDLKQDTSNYFVSLAGQVTDRPGRFSQSISATLKADDLTVLPADPQQKTATSEEPVVWDWTITPKSSGTKTLIIEVVANIKVGKGVHPVAVRTLREAITIEVSYLQRVMVYAGAMNGYLLGASAAATAIAGLVGFVPSIRTFFSRRRRRQTRLAQQQATTGG